MTLNRSIPAFHLMVKPAGASCNLRCQYCFYLPKKSLYSDDHVRMSDEVLKEYTRQYIEAQSVREVTFAWQGGEPTLMGLDFYRRAIELQNKYRKPGMSFENTIQTNGILLDDNWCAFLKENNFLVGLSLDGPRKLHDAFRIDKNGQGSFDRVTAGLKNLQKHGVEYNILATVHAVNSNYPLDVYRFFKDEIQAKYIQFIPIVEKNPSPGRRNKSPVSRESDSTLKRFTRAWCGNPPASRALSIDL